MPSGGYRPPGAPSANPAIADKAEKQQGRGERAQRLAGKTGRTGYGRCGAHIHDAVYYRSAVSEASVVRAIHLTVRATSRARLGPSSSTIMKRIICKAMTKEMSTLSVAAAMMAMESMPPGLVAR